MIEELKDKVRELLKSKQVELVIGYQRATDGVSAKPCFIEKEEDTDLLIWDAYCVYNLANYLNPVRDIANLDNKPIVSNRVKDYVGRKVGIIVKPCDVKSIIVLLQENQLRRQDLFIIGIECLGVIDEKRLIYSDTQTHQISFAQKCKVCLPPTVQFYDYFIKEKEEKTKVSADYDGYESIRKMEAKAISERFKFWQEEFSRCIRCYACRQICPMCYCPRCVADQTQPAWFSKATNLEGNLSWNVTRAMHLAGRCIDCGECERACPVGIPLREINKKIEKDVKELFNYESGKDVEQKPLLSCFDKNDPEDWIR